MYVAEPIDHPAKIDINAEDLFAPMTFGENGTGKDVHLTITRIDPYLVLPDIDFRDSNTVPEITLERLPDHGRDFTVTAWVDANQNEVFDSGDDSETLLIHVVPPWTRGDWTGWSILPCLAIAGVDNAPLEDLAKDITGNTADAAKIHVMGPVARGQLINVRPLIRILEQNIRSNTVVAAMSRKYAHFPQPTSDGTFEKAWSLPSEEAVNCLFDGGWPERVQVGPNEWVELGPKGPAMACLAVAHAVLARGLMTTVGPGFLDDWTKWAPVVEGDRPDRIPLPLVDREVAIENTKPGDLVYFENAWDYPFYADPPWWIGENTIKIVGDRYWGWGSRGGHAWTADEWEGELFYQYMVASQYQGIFDVEGYVGAQFFNVPLVAQEAFDWRTQPTRT